MSAIRKNLPDGDKNVLMRYLPKLPLNFNNIKFMHKLYSAFFSEI